MAIRKKKRPYVRRKPVQLAPKEQRPPDPLRFKVDLSETEKQQIRDRVRRLFWKG